MKELLSLMISQRSRTARSRLAVATRTGREDVEAAQTAYDVERAIDALQGIRGAITPEQHQRLHDAVEASGGDES